MPATVALIFSRVRSPSRFSITASSTSRTCAWRRWPDGVFARVVRIQHGQGARARLFRAAGHEDPGAHRRAVAGRQHGPQRAIVLPLALMHPLPGLHALLALNTGIGAWFNATMLYRGLRKQHVLHHAPAGAARCGRSSRATCSWAYSCGGRPATRSGGSTMVPGSAPPG